MNDSTAALAVLTGLALRMLVPILITAVVVLLLTRLDRHWQSEGSALPLKVQKPECWKTRRCSASSRQACPGYSSDLPCWQVFRLSSGYLNEKCLGCPVLIAAPVPHQA